MIEIGSWIGLAAMTQSDTVKDVAYDELGVIPSIFRKLGVNLKEREMIFLFLQEYYEIESFIDGSIMTISDALGQDFLRIY